jgi:hypothetical protein
MTRVAAGQTGRRWRPRPGGIQAPGEGGGHRIGHHLQVSGNSVAQLMKSLLEETILRIAPGAIMLVVVGIFVLLSLPPLPKEITDILIKNSFATSELAQPHSSLCVFVYACCADAFEMTTSNQGLFLIIVNPAN